MKYKVYSEYLKQQIVRAESKWGRKGDYDVSFRTNLSRNIQRADLPDLKSICCMGIRDGTEMFVLRQHFKSAEIHGLDITKNIKTIKLRGDKKIFIHQQDFNHLPAEWTDKFDMVFSNSLDHAYDPKETLKEWRRVIKSDGYLLLELSMHSETNIEHQFKPIDTIRLFKDFPDMHSWTDPSRNSFWLVAKK